MNIGSVTTRQPPTEVRSRSAEPVRSGETSDVPPTPTPTPPLKQKPAELSRDSLKALAEQVSKQAEINGRSLSFTIDDDIGRTVVKVIDRETEEVIRQIPSEELIRVARAVNALNEQLSDAASATGKGLLLDEQA